MYHFPHYLLLNDYTSLKPDVKATITDPIMIALYRIPVNLSPCFWSFFIFPHLPSKKGKIHLPFLLVDDGPLSIE